MLEVRSCRIHECLVDPFGEKMFSGLVQRVVFVCDAVGCISVLCRLRFEFQCIVRAIVLWCSVFIV